LVIILDINNSIHVSHQNGITFLKVGYIYISHVFYKYERVNCVPVIRSYQNHYFNNLSFLIKNIRGENGLVSLLIN